MDWKKVAEGRTDEELYEILSRRGDFDAEPMQEYEREFERRGLDGQRVADTMAAIATQKAVANQARLSPFEKIRLIIDPVSSVVRVEGYRARGQYAKHDQAYRYIGIGLVGYILLIGWFVLKYSGVL